MRYCLISDIHSNLEAFQSVLDAAAGERIDKFLSVGDVIGYAADPQAVIRLLKSITPAVLIAGNHDWGVAGLFDLEYFNENAKRAALWTKGVLKKIDIEYLVSFKLTYEFKSFTLVHGSLDMPGKFNYILSTDDAYETMKLMKSPLCFVGHSHVAGIFYSDGRNARLIKGTSVKIEKDKKYVVNIGSIGQPRDGDPRASYAVYDEEAASVEIRRVAYDIKAAQKKILEAGLPSWLAARLSEGR